MFDWLFGTLLIPGAEPERLTFGVEAEGERPHSAEGAVITPFVRVWRMHRAPLPKGAETIAKRSLAG